MAVSEVAGVSFGSYFGSEHEKNEVPSKFQSLTHSLYESIAYCLVIVFGEAFFAKRRAESIEKFLSPTGFLSLPALSSCSRYYDYELMIAQDNEENFQVTGRKTFTIRLIDKEIGQPISLQLHQDGRKWTTNIPSFAKNAIMGPAINTSLLKEVVVGRNSKYELNRFQVSETLEKQFKQIVQSYATGKVDVALDEQILTEHKYGCSTFIEFRMLNCSINLEKVALLLSENFLKSKGVKL